MQARLPITAYSESADMFFRKASVEVKKAMISSASGDVQSTLPK
jgi:hypothetical protein